MTLDQLAVVAALVAVVGLLVRRTVSPTVAVVGAATGLFLLGVLDGDALLAGFANPAPATIAALYVVAGGVQRTGALAQPLHRLLGNRPRRFPVLLAGVAALSAVVANTPIVAMLISPVISWSERVGRSASRHLLPLSYAAILGGMVTVIGTSTNLVASGALVAAGLDPIAIFEPATLGLPVAVVGLALTSVVVPRVLRDRRSATVSDADVAAFTADTIVVAGGPIDGRTVAEAGLRNLPGVFVVAASRAGELWAPVGPDHRLQGGDVLTFAGRVDSVVELSAIDGLQLAEGPQITALDDAEHRWFEAVVGAGSPLVGQTLKQIGFRARYQAAVVGMRRAGERVEGGLGDVQLHIGDSLLLVADNDFRGRWMHRGDFLLIRGRDEPPPTARAKAPIALVIMAAMAIVAATGVTSVLRAAVGGAVAMVAAGVLTPAKARDSIDLNVVVMIGAALAVGRAATDTGLAARAAQGVLAISAGRGPWVAALVLVVVTLLATEAITNAGAVALLVPLALEVAAETGADPRRFALAVMVSASASFITPIGYQTNTMVYGPGQYHLSDYARAGLPLTLAVLVIVPVLAAR